MIRPLRGSRETGDHCHDRRFPGAGAPEKRGDAASRLEGDVEGEVATPVLKLKHETQSAACLWRMRRAKTSERISAESEMTIDTRLSLIAAVSAPGICRTV